MAKTSGGTRRPMMGAGALVLAVSLLACGARNDLLGVDGAAGDGDGTPTAIANGAIFFATDRKLQGESRIASIRDMSGDGYATHAGPAGFEASCVHTLDSRGLLLLTDDFTRRVLRLDLETGRLDEAPFPGSLASAYDVAVDADDRVFVADADGSRIIRYDRFQDGDGFAFGGFGSGAGELMFPRGVAVKADGKVLIADTGNGRIAQIDDLIGNGWQEWTVPGNWTSPWDIAVDSAGRIYVTDAPNGALWRIDDISGSGAVQLELPGYQPSSVFVDTDGRIYVTSTDSISAVLRVDDMEGTNLVVFTGSEDQPLLIPCGIVVR